MARVTVEDCAKHVPNRFELVLLASVRAREIEAGVQVMLPRDHDKNPVVALREIASNVVELNSLREKILRQRPSTSFFDSEEDDVTDETTEEPTSWSATVDAPEDDGSSYQGENITSITYS